MWSPNELLKIEKQRDILSYITLQFFHFKKVPLEHCPFLSAPFFIMDCTWGHADQLDVHQWDVQPDSDGAGNY